ncbi:MAG: cupin domain-containing protein [Gammaproteobacteria bacterium]|nr:cupin domain-containing protein [Gammaproteobacteria bacterium]
MSFRFKLVITFLSASFLFSSVADDSETVLPAKISKVDLAGAMFERVDMTPQTHADGHQTESVTSMVSSDGKYYSGMYRSEATRIDITDRPYGVDEFMYFLSGSVTLTSLDGSVMTIHAGEAVTLPKEWRGIFATDGYEKIWVIYSTDE